MKTYISQATIPVAQLLEIQLYYSFIVKFNDPLDGIKDSPWQCVQGNSTPPKSISGQPATGTAPPILRARNLLLYAENTYQWSPGADGP